MPTNEIDVLIRGGDVVLPESTGRYDVRVTAGRIAEIGPELRPDGVERVVDADGLLVLPGLIDCHTHFGLDTGQLATRDDFEAGSTSAAAGGVTTYVNFASPIPGEDMSVAVAHERARAAGASLVDFGLHLSVGTPGDDIERQLREIVALGVTSVKAYTTYRDSIYYTSDWDLLRLMKAAAPQGVLVMVHAENDDVLAGRAAQLQAAGPVSFREHGTARPAVAETEAVARTIEFARETGCPAYLVHLTTPTSVELVQQARGAGVEVFAESCAHHLALDDQLYDADDAARYVMTPPLRPPALRRKLSSLAAAGGIQAAGSDHCGYSLDQRGDGTSFTAVTAGIPGVETLFRVLLAELGGQGMPIEAVCDLVTRNPAAIFGLSGKGRIEVGSDGDVVLFDPSFETVLDERELHSQAGYSPFHGLRVRGRVVQTFSRGRSVFVDGEVVGEPGHGRFVACAPFARDRAAIATAARERALA